MDGVFGRWYEHSLVFSVAVLNAWSVGRRTHRGAIYTGLWVRVKLGARSQVISIEAKNLPSVFCSNVVNVVTRGLQRLSDGTYWEYCTVQASTS
jgi:hypothetical protein